ncbi:unnamed protein product [Arctogadus glacialis]
MPREEDLQMKQHVKLPTIQAKLTPRPAGPYFNLSLQRQGEMRMKQQRQNLKFNHRAYGAISGTWSASLLPLIDVEPTCFHRFHQSS